MRTIYQKAFATDNQGTPGGFLLFFQVGLTFIFKTEFFITPVYWTPRNIKGADGKGKTPILKRLTIAWADQLG